MAKEKKKTEKGLVYGDFWSYVDGLVGDLKKPEAISLQQEILSLVFARLNDNNDS